MTMRIRSAIAGAIGVWLAVVASLSPQPVAATHVHYLSPELPNVRFWDLNLNNIPDSAPINFYAKGQGWTSLAQIRIDNAGNEWDGDTNFNIDTFNWTTGTTNTRLVWRGKDDSSCPTDDIVGQLASNTWTSRPVFRNGSVIFWRMQTSCISFNEARYDFYFGSGFATGYYHWQGVLTHEMGHSVRLEHPDTSQGDPACDWTSGDVDAVPTLCGNPDQLSTAQEQLVSYWRRTLEPADVHSANWVYALTP